MSSQPLRNCYWVLPGELLAGEHPGGSTPEATRERLRRLLGAGIDCFVDLTHAGELAGYDVQLPLNVEYIRKPIRDHGIPDDRARMGEILDALHDALRAGRHVYVHCRAGIGRTGMVVGCLLVASRIRPVAIVGVVIVVVALLIVSRMAIEAFSRSRR